MRRFLPLTLLAVLVGSLLVWDCWQQQGRGAPVPPPVSGGNALVDPSQPVTVVHVWATWCASCMAEMPGMLPALQTPHPGVRVVMLAIDERPEAWAAFQRRYGPLPHTGVSWLQDPSQTWVKRYVGNLSLPVTMVYRRNGTLLQRINTPIRWDDFLANLAGL